MKEGLAPLFNTTLVYSFKGEGEEKKERLRLS